MAFRAAPLILAAFCISPAAAQISGDCSKHGFVNEGPPGEYSASNLTLTPFHAAKIPQTAVPSPNLRYAFWVDNPDTMKDGPWEATLFAEADGQGAMLHVANIANGLDPKWINENLIYVRVAFGRIAFTDLIIDAETAKAVYAQDVYYRCIE